MNFLVFFSHIILCYIVYTDCHPLSDDSVPGETDGNGVSDSDEIDFTNLHDEADVSAVFQAGEYITFDLLLLDALSTQNSKKNIVVSPSSIQSLLALIARVYSKDKVNAILEKSPDKGRSISLIWDLHTLLYNNGTDITIESRNKIFEDNDAHLAANEVQNAGGGTKDDNDDATLIQTLDFSDPTAADVINKWVNESTRGLIPSIFAKHELSKQIKRVLLNCVYLKAKWDITFDPSLTNDSCFYTSGVSGECRQVKFMHVERQLKYAELSATRSIMFDLPFADPRYAITIVLPNENVSVTDVVTSLKNENLFKLFGRMGEKKVKLALPRTTIEFKDDNLLDTLKQPIMKSFFGTNAKLDQLLKEDTLSVVDTLFHRAKIILNENGAEAAAVSGGIQFRSSFLDEERIITVDRPFLFFLRDTKADLIIFEGIVYSPDGAD